MTKVREREKHRNRHIICSLAESTVFPPRSSINISTEEEKKSTLMPRVSSISRVHDEHFLYENPI